VEDAGENSLRPLLEKFFGSRSRLSKIYQHLSTFINKEKLTMIGFIKKMFQGKSYYLEDQSESSSSESSTSAPAMEEQPEPVKVEAEKSESVPAVEVEPSPNEGETKVADPEKVVQSKEPVAVSPSTSNTLELIKAAVQKPTPQAQEKSEEGGSTFAPDYLLYTKTQAKRRPGACMDSFLKMARQKS
jgi:FtsZ-interacting cell division protein ZipA